MHAKLSQESAEWMLPSKSNTPRSVRSAQSVRIDHELERPVGVSREGFKNYLRNSGSLNIGAWAIEGRRSATSSLERTDSQLFADQGKQPKVIGDEAKKNYLKQTRGTPDILTSDYQPPRSHNQMRISRAGRANYLKDRESRVKSLLQNYGKLSPHATSTDDDADPPRRGVFEQHKRDRVGELLGNYSHFPTSARPVAHVKGDLAEKNLQKGLGSSNIIAPDRNFRPPTSDPHIKGEAAEHNYALAQGRAISSLFQDYGKVPISPRIAPKIKYGGVDNYNKGRGDAMRKTLSQCPPSHRIRERPLPVQI